MITKKVLILGSTGSIGLSTLDVLALNLDQYQVWGLTANTDDESIISQILKYQPQYVAMSDPLAAKKVNDFVKASSFKTIVLSGDEALAELAAHDDVDIVMAAIVGSAGLIPTLAAASAGKKILLANKEALVCAGHLFMDAVERGGAILMPVDSEHNAIFQCLPQSETRPDELTKQIRKVVLTGSGGPFRGWSKEQLQSVNPDQACAHPNWSMGRKISVDSATMMNKGLELIEACWLFDLGPNDIEIVLHPQSIVHSMVEYQDGSVLAQMGCPDMRTPIAHALSWPERINSGVDSLDFNCLNLNFEKPDFSSYPCLKIAIDCAQSMGAMPTILNAANEIAVGAFLNESITFLDIASVAETVLEKLSFREPESIDDVLAIDAEARRVAGAIVDIYKKSGKETPEKEARVFKVV